MISCRIAPDVDAPAPEAPAEVEGFPVDKALMADAGLTEVFSLLRTRTCKAFKRTILGIMMNKKVVDAAVTCQEEMTKVVDMTKMMEQLSQQLKLSLQRLRVFYTEDN